MKTKNDFIIYDTETDLNVSFCGFKKGDEFFHFDFLNPESIKNMLNFLSENKKKTFVGFNNYHYDNYIIDYVLNNNHNNHIDYTKIRDLSNSIINNDYNNFFYNLKKKRKTFQPDNEALKNSVDLTDYYPTIKGGLKKWSFFKNNYCFKKSLKTLKNIEEFYEYNKEDLIQTESLLNNDIFLELSCVDYMNNIFKTNFTNNRDIINHYVFKQMNINPNFDFFKCMKDAKIDNDLIEISKTMIENLSTTNKKIEEDIENLENGLKIQKEKIKYKKDEIKEKIKRTKELEKLGLISKKSKRTIYLKDYVESLTKKKLHDGCEVLEKYNETSKCLEKNKNQLDYNLNHIKSKEGINIKYGGLHYPEKKEKWEFYDECFYGDFSSYYPNIYIHYLNFISDKDKEFLLDILKKRLVYKKEGKKIEATALKLFLNSLFGKLKYRDCNRYDNITLNDYVCLMGEFLGIQFLRNNNIELKNIIEINTDGFILNKKTKK